jgi:hypothetical protein
MTFCELISTAIFQISGGARPIHIQHPEPTIAPRQQDVSSITHTTNNSPQEDSTDQHSEPSSIPYIQERLNPSNYPDLPTIWNVSKYSSLKQLVQLKGPHKHDSVSSNLLSVTKNGPLSGRKDHWVKIKRIYRRIGDRLKEGGDSIVDEISAADDLDKKERNGKNLNAYSLWLASAFNGKYSSKRRRLS